MNMQHVQEKNKRILLTEERKNGEGAKAFSVQTVDKVQGICPGFCFSTGELFLRKWYNTNIKSKVVFSS